MTKKNLVLISCFAFLFLLQGCNDNTIELVKNGNFPGYPNATIGQILDASFDSTEWTTEETAKGENEF